MPGRAPARTRIPFVALALVPVVFHLVIVETASIPLGLAPHFGALFKLGLVAVAASAHWAIYATLLATFAWTLRPGHEPLITAMSRRMNGRMTDELAGYTRRVTIAWCGFFAAQLATSLALFLLTPLVVWSFFVNILDLPLVATMFAAEYLVRRRCLSDPPRHSPAAILDMIAGLRHARAGAPGPL